MAIKTLIFDFDGTLVDSEMVHTLATHAFLQSLSVGAPEGNFVGKGLLDFLQALKAAHPSLPHTIEELVERFEDAFMKIAPEQVHPYPKTIELAKQAKERGYTIAIASGSHLTLLKKVSKLFGIDAIFGDAYYSSEDDPAGKPSPDLFLRVANILQVSPEKALVLEDSYPGYMAAQNANMPVLMLPDPRFSSQHTFDNADLLFDTPNNLDIDTVFTYCETH